MALTVCSLHKVARSPSPTSVNGLADDPGKMTEKSEPFSCGSTADDFGTLVDNLMTSYVCTTVRREREVSSSVGAWDSSRGAVAAPLPTQRALSKFMCRIIDGDAYNQSNAIAALRQVEEWATQDGESGGFANDFVDLGGVMVTLHFLEDNISHGQSVQASLAALTALVKSGSPTGKVEETVVAHSGVELLIRAFDVHFRAGTVTQAPEEEEGLWASIRGMLQASEMPTVISDGLRLAADDDDEEGSKVDSSNEAAIMAIEALRRVLPYAPAAQAGKVVEAMSGIAEELSGHGDRLCTAVTDCLVDSVKKSEIRDPWEITRVTLQIMKQYPDHDTIIKNGCLVLQSACARLSKEDRGKIGVVAMLGSILASDTMSAEVKAYADNLLEQLMK